MMERNWKRIGAWCGIAAGISFVILTFANMLIFPGGYDFLENYFSELGLSVVNAVETPFNWFLFAAATTLAGMLSIPFWLSLRTLFMDVPVLKILASLGSAIGIIAGPLLAGIGIFAADLYLWEHAFSTIFFFLLFSSAIIIYSVAILLNKEYENVYALVGVVVAIICYTHILIPGFGNALMQKAAVYSLVLYSVFQGHKLLKVL